MNQAISEKKAITSAPMRMRAYLKKTVDHRFDWAWEKAGKEEDSRRRDINFNRNDFLDIMLRRWDEENHPDDRYEVSYIMDYRDLVKVELGGGLVVRHGYEVLSVMRSTGLTDRHGQEVFEGDFLSWKDPQDPARHLRLGMVAYVRHGFALVDRLGAVAHENIEYSDEIIGNVHENPWPRG